MLCRSVKPLSVLLILSSDFQSGIPFVYRYTLKLSIQKPKLLIVFIAADYFSTPILHTCSENFEMERAATFHTDRTPLYLCEVAFYCQTINSPSSDIYFDPQQLFWVSITESKRCLLQALASSKITLSFILSIYEPSPLHVPDPNCIQISLSPCCIPILAENATTIISCSTSIWLQKGVKTGKMWGTEVCMGLLEGKWDAKDNVKTGVWSVLLVSNSLLDTPKGISKSGMNGCASAAKAISSYTFSSLKKTDWDEPNGKQSYHSLKKLSFLRWIEIWIGLVHP